MPNFFDKYPYTDILEQNKALIQEAINNPDVNY